MTTTTTATTPSTTPSAKPRKKALRAVVYGLIGLVALMIVFIAWTAWRVRAALPQLDGNLAVAGLAAPVQVLRDARGVPHIRAESLPDVFFAQGYITAADRLWQMDLSRRLAHGELSEIFGSRALAPDRENRTLGFSQAAERGTAELPSNIHSLLDSYTAGVNAFIESHRDRLPIEFVMLGYQPRPWRDADSMAVALNMAKMLNNSWESDLMREKFRAQLAPDLYADLFPQDSPLEHPVAVPVEAKPGAASAGRTTAGMPAVLGAKPDRGLDPVLDALTSNDDMAALGSNNWVISGAHTASGKPLLSNDPHIGHSVPSVWYMIHLEAPGLNVSGVSLPGGPAVVIGHNEHIAWGMTNTGPDVQDLYEETFDPANPNRYSSGGQWADAEVRDEVVKVRGAADEHLTVRTTRHGPIVSNEGGRALALAWTALEPHALKFALVGMNQARNWQDFATAIRDFTGPEQNMVYADTDGNIGYYAPAWVPMRRQGDGSVPVPGASGDYDWQGYIPFEALPHAFNPPSGIVATANSRVVPDGYPYFFTRFWAAPFRTARIFQLLEAGTPDRTCAKPGQAPASGPAAASGAKSPASSASSTACFTVDDMLRIDTDIHGLDDAWLNDRLIRASAAHPPQSDDARQALAILKNWNGEDTAKSPAPLILHDTLISLRERLLAPKVGPELAKQSWSLETIFVERVVDGNIARWLPPGDADFDATLTSSLEAGVRRIEQRLPGPALAGRHWGDSIPLTFHHPLDSLPIVGHRFDVGPFPQAGTAQTVKATTPAMGPSMRMVVDLGNLDNSVQNITLGESGEITSPYYSDQFQAWYHGRSFPMLFSDQAVDQGAVHRLTLTPEK